MTKYIVYGEKDCLFNHLPSFVIINIICKTEEEAKAALEERRYSYKKLKIIQQDAEEPDKK